MNTIRGSLSGIPGTISNLIGSMPTPISLLSIGRRLAIEQAPTPTAASVMETSASSWSCDDLTDKAQAIPRALITEEWQLVLDQASSIKMTSGALRFNDLFS